MKIKQTTTRGGVGEGERPRTKAIICVVCKGERLTFLESTRSGRVRGNSFICEILTCWKISDLDNLLVSGGDVGDSVF